LYGLLPYGGEPWTLSKSLSDPAAALTLTTQKYLWTAKVSNNEIMTKVVEEVVG